MLEPFLNPLDCIGSFRCFVRRMDNHYIQNLVPDHVLICSAINRVILQLQLKDTISQSLQVDSIDFDKFEHKAI